MKLSYRRRTCYLHPQVELNVTLYLCSFHFIVNMQKKNQRSKKVNIVPDA